MPDAHDDSPLSLNSLQDALRCGEPMGEMPVDTPDYPRHHGPLSEDEELVRVAGKDIRSALLNVGSGADPQGLSIAGFLIEGDLDLSGIRDMPHLAFNNCRFTGAMSLKLSSALSLDMNYVSAPSVVAQGLTLHGDLGMTACHFDEDLALNGAQIGGRLDIIATRAKTIDADKMVVNSYMSWLWSDAEQFSFRSGQCCGPHTDGANINLALSNVGDFDVSYALFTGAVGIGFGGDSRAPKSNFESMTLEGAHVGGALDFDGVFGEEIDAKGLRVDGSLSLPTREDAPGGINLTAANVGDLHLRWDESNTEILSARADGTKFWTVGRVLSHVPFTRPVDVPDRSSRTDGFNSLIAWLPHFKDWTPAWSYEKTLSKRRFFAQPWMEIANALESNGRSADAVTVRIACADKRKREEARTWVGQLGRVLTRVTIGHGFKNVRALWLLALTYVASLTLVYFYSAAFEPIGGDNPSGLWTPLYALDVVISPVGSGQSEQWGAGVLWLAATLWVLKFISWGLAGLFVSGVSGIVSPSSKP